MILRDNMPPSTLHANEPQSQAEQGYSESLKTNQAMRNRLDSNASLSSATSTEETVFSDDDSVDTDDEHYYELTSEGDHEDDDNASASSDDEYQVPQFHPLIRDGDPSRAMSFSVVDEIVEVVPTEQVESVLPIWIKDWNQQRKEWGQLQKAIKLKRCRTHNDANHPFNQSPQLLEENNHLTTPIDVRRNYSEPLNFAAANHSVTAATSPRLQFKQNKYGSHPSQPYPHSRNPNPIVVKSSKKIGKKHARYALTAGMMLGIRESVGGALGVEAEIEISRWEEWERCWEEDFSMDQEDEEVEEDVEGVPVDLTKGLNEDIPQDGTNPIPKKRSSAAAAAASLKTLTHECDRVSKYKFLPHQFYLGNNPNSPTSKPLPHKYKFKVYAPLVFARIRSLFGVEKQPFLHSICGKFNFYEFASNAKSGQFFFYSHDGRYMIKTLTYTESKFLREILPFYYRHLTRYPHTFLTHFYGMYRVCMPHLNNQRLHFIIMKSVFNTEKKIDRVWDLKGSRTGRKSKPGDLVGKDLDILEEGFKLKFTEKGTKEAFLEQLLVDATFLARLGIMDYSLLLGKHSRKENETSCSDIPEDPLHKKESELINEREPCRSNTPFRRGVLKRAASDRNAATANDGFNALEELDQAMVSKPKTTKRQSGSGMKVKDKGGCFKNALVDETAAAPSASSYDLPGPSNTTLGQAEAHKPNPITSRSDLGMEGGVMLPDGTWSCKELYYCGIIDILQYYNARKMGETVMKQATGNSSQDISCVDPESYGKRFVKFISNLVEE